MSKSLVWEHILQQLNYTDGNMIITAEDIKSCKNSWKGKNCQFEPRLLCNINNYEDLPNIFKVKNINIIAIENGKYLLTKTNIYHDLEFSENNIIEIEYNPISKLLISETSESGINTILLDCNIFEQILNEKIYKSSIGFMNGRKRLKNIKIILDNVEVDVNGVQFETDF